MPFQTQADPPIARQPLSRALRKHGQQEVIFTDSRSDVEVKRLLKAAIRARLVRFLRHIANLSLQKWRTDH